MRLAERRENGDSKSKIDESPDSCTFLLRVSLSSITTFITKFIPPYSSWGFGVLGWFGGSLVVVWWSFGSGLVVFWWWFGGGLVVFWCWFGAGLVMVWWWRGAGLVVVWC